MNVKEFNKLKKAVKGGNVKGLKKIISDLTLRQAQTIEDLMYDLELTDEMNKVLDELVIHINSLTQPEKIANSKNLKAPKKDDKKDSKKEEKKEEEKDSKKEEKKDSKKDGKKDSKKDNKKDDKKEEGNILDKIKVGDFVKFRVEGEEIEHLIKIIYISRYDIIAITEDEKEVFKIRKIDFKKQIFNWKDKHDNEYNIIVTL